MEVPEVPLILGVIVCLIIGAVGGMAFGKPVIISLEESQIESLEDQCDTRVERLERDQAKEMDKSVKRLSERNQELIEDNAECDEKWQALYEDLNVTEHRNFLDLNKAIYDLNCRK